MLLCFLQEYMELIVANVALVISIVALVYTVKAYVLKAGIDVRCNWTIASSRESDDMYVSNLTLENNRDRSLVIFKIHLKIGHNYYVQLEDHKEKPLVIAPFEVYQKEYPMPVRHMVHSRRVNLNNLLRQWNTPRKIILSTTQGPFVISKGVQSWDPAWLSLKNEATIVVKTKHLPYRETFYGGNVKFIVELYFSPTHSQIIPLLPRDHQLPIFQHFRLTPDSLSSALKLKSYLQKQKRLGRLPYKRIHIVDFQHEIEKRYEFFQQPAVDAEYMGWFRYYIVERIMTMIYRRRRRRVVHKLNRPK